MKRKQAARENSRGFTKEQSPQGGAFSWDLLDQVKVPAIPWRCWGGGGGAWLQITGVLVDD